MKALGFGGGYVALLIFGESLAIALIGGVIGVAAHVSARARLRRCDGRCSPIFFISDETLAMQLGAALIVGLVAAALPAWRAANIRIVDGLRAVG